MNRSVTVQVGWSGGALAPAPPLTPARLNGNTGVTRWDLFRPGVRPKRPFADPPRNSCNEVIVAGDYLFWRALHTGALALYGYHAPTDTEFLVQQFADTADMVKYKAF